MLPTIDRPKPPPDDRRGFFCVWIGCMDGISEREIQAAVAFAIAKHGAEAAEHARSMVESYTDLGNALGAQTWRRIAEAIQALQPTTPAITLTKSGHVKWW